MHFKMLASTAIVRHSMPAAPPNVNMAHNLLRNLENLPQLARISTALGAMYSTTAIIDAFGVFCASMVRHPKKKKKPFSSSHSSTATTDSHPGIRTSSIHFSNACYRGRIRCWGVVLCAFGMLFLFFKSLSLVLDSLMSLYPGRSDPPMHPFVHKR